ncbi:FAD-dependent oxidoreductase [Pedobacter frigiditerrae]|uniref:FAD-dependent oxidoreductase n=1 Tax=Pedobacter frigiditerrae TaxID=2530452 RepID=A0A4R0MTF9_9SPHI|nr:FAD-dependent oxidoreductase [Pedobacter frigiditerrae]TCC90338.1 FAD-dependent oxidoreductase [Pedobacter frigiditerrae]
MTNPSSILPITSSTNKGNITIIGAGIIGLCSAYYLLKEGFKVTLLEQGDLINNCSSGNAGMIVPSHFVPLAAPGMISKGIKWMFDSKSPFYVKPSLNPALISWGLKFWKYSNQSHVDKSAEPLRDLHLLSKQLYDDLAKEPELDFGLEKKGILMLYKSQATGEEEIHLAKKAQSLGLDVEPLTAAQTQALEPDTALDILGSVHYRCDAHLSPSDLVQQLVAYLKKYGVEMITNCQVTGFETNAGKITAIKTTNETYTPDLVIMTGGSWLPELAKKADLNIPIMPGKGYSFMVEPNGHQIHHPSLLLEARVAVTPMNGQIRFGGTMEIAPMNDKTNMNRVEGIVNSIPNYYPDYQVPIPQIDKIWYGFRPCSPDGLPYIGFTQKLKNLIIAGGHGMMGVSLAPATGKLVAELAVGSKLSVGVGIYKADRFG